LIGDEHVERKLVAILAADVVGYSRLMGIDEEGTLAALKGHRRALIDPTITAHRGRIVKTTGDGMLVAFDSVVDAVRCAVEVQQAMVGRNEALPEERRIVFRVGINLGDIILDEDDIFGDGVNIAARLEGLAPPGGICVSGVVRDQVRDKLEITFADMGQQHVKNIARPIPVFRIVLPGERWRLAAFWQRLRSKRPLVAAAAALMVLALAGAVLVLEPWRVHVEAASVEKMAFPLPDRPSIAVMSFVNLGSDQADAYIADGLTEDITDAISKIPSLFVISRNSMEGYKSGISPMNTVAEALGVRYLLGGSVQRDGDRLRVRVQLVDAVGGVRLWSEKYDRSDHDLFAVQDDITANVAVELDLRVNRGEDDRFHVGSTGNLDAWADYSRGMEAYLKFTPEGNLRARELFQRAVALDPHFWRAKNRIAWTYFEAATLAFDDRKAALDEARRINQEILEAAPNFAAAHRLRSRLLTAEGDYDGALAEAKKAIELDPNGAEQYYTLGRFMFETGKYQEALDSLARARRLNPNSPTYYFEYIGRSLLALHRTDAALAVFTQGAQRWPDTPVMVMGLLLANSLAGHNKEARAQVAKLLSIDPSYTLQREVVSNASLKDRALATMFEDAARKAGLPE
jgi:class 3 adenylate cyclase/TolB-like protein/cytochrome c-type biogenesis protein CcmH/NrfG